MIYCMYSSNVWGQCRKQWLYYFVRYKIHGGQGGLEFVSCPEIFRFLLITAVAFYDCNQTVVTIEDIMESEIFFYFCIWHIYIQI